MKLIKKRARYNQADGIVSIMVFIYFMSILSLFIVGNDSNRKLFYHIISIICVFEYLLVNIENGKIKISYWIVVYILTCGITGLLNSIIVGNVSYLNVIECSIINPIIASLFVSEQLNIKWIEGAIYVYAIYIILRYLQEGIYSRVLRFSNNQVSVLMIIPVTMYYIMTDMNSVNTNILPALITWIISLLARGRSGIFSSTILFVAVFFRYYREIMKRGSQTREAKMAKIIFRFLIIICGIYFVYYFYSMYSGILLEKFIVRGVDNSARWKMWKEYIEQTMKSAKNFLFGTPKRNLIIGTLYSNNTHNSFISIHADNGIVMFALSIFLLLQSIVFSIKRKKWLYFVSILVFCFRSIFDNVFWGTWGTTTFIYILFVPLLYKRRERIKLMRNNLAEMIE